MLPDHLAEPLAVSSRAEGLSRALYSDLGRPSLVLELAHALFYGDLRSGFDLCHHSVVESPANIDKGSGR